MEYISREDAREMAARIALASVDGNITCGDVKRFVDSIPSADVAEVKRGKWIKEKQLTWLGVDVNNHHARPQEYFEHRCSICGFTTGELANGYRYCPYCGAKMERM